MPKKNTKGVARLRKISRILDQLRKELSEVAFLAADITDKKKFKEAEELAEAVRKKLTSVQDAIAKKGGPSVAKEYR